MILSLIGVMIGLLIWQLPFGIIMTGIGVISLAGVVVNNAIVLLDYTQKLQARGMDLVAAATEAGRLLFGDCPVEWALDVSVVEGYDEAG